MPEEGFNALVAQKKLELRNCLPPMTIPIFDGAADAFVANQVVDIAPTISETASSFLTA